MSGIQRSILRSLAVLALCFSALQPLRAQLDTRLQAGNTDFLDLYQQSTSLQAKPEIATIFDASFSMNALMFHPLYQNNDLQDADDYRSMQFTLTGGGVGAAYTNTYTITAKNANCTNATATYVVTLTSPTTATGAGSNNGVQCNGVACNQAPDIKVTAAANGAGAAATTLTFHPGSGTNPTYTVISPSNAGAKTGSAANNYTMETSSGSTATPTIVFTATKGGVAQVSPYPTGTLFTFTVYMAHQMVTEPQETVNDELVNWSTGLVTACANASAGTITRTGNTPSPANSTNFFVSTATWTIPAWSPAAAGTPAQLASIALATGSPAVAPGNTIKLVTYFITQGGASSNITWTQANGSNPCPAAPAAKNPVLTGSTGNVTTAGTTLISATTVTWTVPLGTAYCTGNSTGTPYTVTVTLDTTAPAVPITGVLYLTSKLQAATNTNGVNDMNSVLRKPDGTAVLQADADAAVTGRMATPAAPALGYEHLGAADVRNWIRAASHARLPYTYTNPQTSASVTRTIDIPIPWNITDATQTGNPLTSTKLLDKEAVINVVSGVPITTNWGSQPLGGTPAIEIDSTYMVENVANAVFASNAVNTSSTGGLLPATTTTTVYLYGVVYRPAYISWLYTGVYQHTQTDSTVAGGLNYTSNATLYGTAGKNYIAFDAKNGLLVPNQGTAHCNVSPGINWGAAFGPTGTSWGTVSVPTVSPDGTQTGLDVSPARDASTYRTPSLTRLQAVKTAAITTWINYQANVYWAFRELDPSITESNGGAGSSFNNNSITALSAASPTTTHLNGLDSGWTVLNNTTAQGINATNGNSVTGMTRIAYMFASGQTPLTYALARTLVQMNDPSTTGAFYNVELGNVSQCESTFLLLFTDGIDNNGNGINNPNTTTPYITGTAPALALDAQAGNDEVIKHPSKIDTTGIYWNIYTFAGMGAHLSDPSIGVSGTDFMPQPVHTSITSGAPETFMPFAINQRSGVPLAKDHQITIMTVGVGLGGKYTNPASPKANLFYSAVVGNPATKTGSLNPADTTHFHAFNPPTGTYPGSWVANDWIAKPQDPGDYPTLGIAAPGAVYFFDGSDPASVVNAMKYAFAIAVGSTTNNSTSSPDLPFVGASLGNEVYLGSFYPPQIGGVVWPGDLMMFGTQNTNGIISFIDQNGAANTNLNASTAQWDASSVMNAQMWNTRHLYTRYQATSTAEPAISAFTYQGSGFTGGTDPIFSNVDPAATLAIKQAVIQFAAGGDTTSGNPPTKNRGTIMGDIINSAPASVSYKFSDVSSGFFGNLSAGSGWTGFNLILVGTNQGWLHAFGEVTQTVANPTQTGKTMVKANVQELWAFMPTDFLHDLQTITVATNTHRHMVDGTPAIYFLDLPPSGGGSGNGVIDSTERAVAIISLGKGGRSYYALDIHDPFTPKILWSLVPDEWNNFPTGRIVANGPSLATVQGVLKNFGFSTCTPAFGRIVFNGVLHDAVFLGGGFTVPEVDANFLVQAPHGLGRSVMALDVYTGAVLGAVDLTDAAIGGNTIGPIGAGLIPFEFILNSGMAQRAYFMDYTGGLWAWGSKNVTATASSFVNFRIDTSEMTNVPASLPSGWKPWAIRKVFQDDNTMATVAGGTNNRYTMLPAPFLVANFPGPAYNSQSLPAAVGVAMISGDRNNPLDRSYTTGNKIPQQHQLTLVFDRQDSRALSLDTLDGPDTGIKPGGLQALPETITTTTPSQTCSPLAFGIFTPGCSNYFLGTSLAPKYGYYINFPSLVSNTFVSKGINPPIVVADSLFYSYFTPTTSDPCLGGTGTTTSMVVGDVMHPVWQETTGTGLDLLSGITASWVGVASNFISVGTTSVIQGGTVKNTDTTSGAAATMLALQSSKTKSSSRYPKVRVWRTVQ